MKKIAALMLAMTLAFSVTACGGNGKEEVKEDETAGKAAVEILEDVLASYEEDEKFPVSGGIGEEMSMEGPGAVSTDDGEILDNVLGFPADRTEMIDDAASMMHMMNQNTFTAGIYHVTDGENLQDIADGLKDNIKNRQWVCGFPDELVVYSVGENFVTAAFGKEETIDVFEDHLTETYPGATLLYEEDLTF